MGDDDDKSNYLRFSDTLAFYAEEGDGYLASEGFADERVVLYHNEGGAEDFKTTKFSGKCRTPGCLDYCLLVANTQTFTEPAVLSLRCLAGQIVCLRCFRRTSTTR